MVFLYFMGNAPKEMDLIGGLLAATDARMAYLPIGALSRTWPAQRMAPLGGRAGFRMLLAPGAGRGGSGRGFDAIGPCRRRKTTLFNVVRQDEACLSRVQISFHV